MTSICELPASLCGQATRPHEHLYDPATGQPSGRIRVYARDRSWVVDTADDGSICSRHVTPTPPTWAPERVLAFLTTELMYIEMAERRLRPDKKGRKIR